MNEKIVYEDERVTILVSEDDGETTIVIEKKSQRVTSLVITTMGNGFIAASPLGHFQKVKDEDSVEAMLLVPNN